MLKKIVTIFSLMLMITSCTASASKAESAPAEGTTEATEITKPDTALMVTTDIPAGSKKVEVETTAGNFTLLLYGDTPRHRDNFLKLVNEHAYDSLLFHRVIENFMVQAGDPDSKNAPAGQMLGGNSIGGDDLAAEIVYPRHYHKRGALAAARTGDNVNPERKSSGSQFYIVTGSVFDEAQLDQLDQRLQMTVAQDHFNGLAQAHRDEIRKYQADGDTAAIRALQEQLINETETWLKTQNLGLTPELRKVYSTIGGAPHLDGQYTVYGEVISGMDTIDKIQKVKKDSHDRPIDDVRIITMKVIDD